MDERTPAVAEVVHVDMDDVVAKLLNNTFKEMERVDN